MDEIKKVREFSFYGPISLPLSIFLKNMRLSGRIYNKEGEYLRKIDELSIVMNVPKNCLTREIVEAWTNKRESESHKTWSNRVVVIRKLAKNMISHGFDAYETTEIIRNKPSDFIPHIYSNYELSKIFEAADNIPAYSNCPNRNHVFSLLFKLLYGCGLRISEALNLKIYDVDLNKGVLTVKESKFEKSRYVPMTQELTKLCKNYVDVARENAKEKDYFFIAPDGGKYSKSAVKYTFHEILYKAGIPRTGKGPRIHDFRHTFAVDCLKKWVLEQEDINVMLPILSAYLGHKNLKGTQRYLRLTADIYPNITTMIEKNLGSIIPMEVAE